MNEKLMAFDSALKDYMSSLTEEDRMQLEKQQQDSWQQSINDYEENDGGS